ncbi:MAG: B12-binding domain-containing radical SAM protein [Promethearchaeota archaeon]
MMQFLLIDALTLGVGKRNFTRDFIGAGPRMVAAAIRAGTHDVTLVRGEKFLENSRQLVKTHDACFISAMSMDWPSVARIASTWKKLGKGLLILGGPIALDYPRLLKSPNIDAVFVGEVEAILPKVLQDDFVNLDDPRTLPPCFLGKESGVPSYERVDRLLTAHRAPIPIIERMDPAIDLISSYQNYWASRIYIECMRGCSNYSHARIPGLTGVGTTGGCIQCGYCNDLSNLALDHVCPSGILPGCGFCSTVPVQGQVRSFNVNHILVQVRKSIEMGARRIVLGGSDLLEYKRELFFPENVVSPLAPPAPNNEALSTLVNKLLDIDEIQEQTAQIFIENIKVSLCSEEALDIISRLPNISLSIGIETGCNEHLASIGKFSNIDMIKTAVRTLNKKGIRYHAYFIHSLPGQSIQTVKKSIGLIGWLATNEVEKITIYKFKPLPWTAFSRYKVDHETLKQSKKLIKTAKRINFARKESMVGTEVDALIAETDFREEGDAIGYILHGGPKIKVKHALKFVNDRKIHKVTVRGVISDKMLLGELASREQGMNRKN